MKLALMHIFLTTYEQSDVAEFKLALQQIQSYGASEISVSPVREYGSYGELYVTLKVDEQRIQDLLYFMSDSWDGPLDDCQCNAFTSKVFDSHINSLYFQLTDD